MFTFSRFTQSLNGLGMDSVPEAVFTELKTAHSAADRYYHSVRHIEECLSHFDEVRHLATQPFEIEVALWFHDAIYDTHRSDNELKSAEWARAVLNDCHVNPEVVARIYDHIIATQHTAEPQGNDSQLLVDIDLAILGQPEPVFDRYDVQIRQEYAWVPENRYRQGRKTILEGFVQRPRIYSTTEFYERYEASARRNLQRAIVALA